MWAVGFAKLAAAPDTACMCVVGVVSKEGLAGNVLCLRAIAACHPRILRQMASSPFLSRRYQVFVSLPNNLCHTLNSYWRSLPSPQPPAPSTHVHAVHVRPLFAVNLRVNGQRPTVGQLNGQRGRAPTAHQSGGGCRIGTCLTVTCTGPFGRIRGVNGAKTTKHRLRYPSLLWLQCTA